MKKIKTLTILLCCFYATLYSAVPNPELFLVNKSSAVLNIAGIEDLRPKLRIGFDAPQIDHRQILLTIDENTSDGFDWGYDAEMFELFEDDIYWVIDQKKYVIQATNRMSIGTEIPLGIQTLHGGDITIKVDSFENPIEGFTIYVKDKETNKIYDIQNNTFKINLPAGEYLDRFVITFLNPKEEPKNDGCIDKRGFNTNKLGFNTNKHSYLGKSKIIIFYDNRFRSLHIINKSCVEVTQINLYTSAGIKIKTWTLNSKVRNTVFPIDVVGGVYLVQVKTKNKTSIKRIYVNKF